MKKIICLVMLLCLVVSMTACSTSTSMSYVFDVETGDRIKVTLDTTDDYEMSSDVPFTISCDDVDVTYGTFITSESYTEYETAVATDELAVVLDSGEKDGNSYIMWSYDNTEFNYAILIDGSDTAVILGNNVSEETAKLCFDRLTISVAD